MYLIGYKGKFSVNVTFLVPRSLGSKQALIRVLLSITYPTVYKFPVRNTHWDFVILTSTRSCV